MDNADIPVQVSDVKVLACCCCCMKNMVKIFESHFRQLMECLYSYCYPSGRPLAADTCDAM